ncbi:superoxide dismutase [Alistipes sp. CAG:831]|nr:superoxide dismutase [Alistipes sp. CAG:831]
MKHLLPELPYALEALEPAMSRETLEYHYGKHLQTYIDNLNRLIQGTPFEDSPLEEIVMKADGGILNNAAQTWNHTFFFNGLTPEQGEMPQELLKAIEKDFGSLDSFKAQFTQTAVSLFGSGWTWLAMDGDGKLLITEEPNAGNPMRKGLRPASPADCGRMGTRLLHRLPQPPCRLHQRLVGTGQLGDRSPVGMVAETVTLRAS